MSPRTLNMYQKALHSYLEEFNTCNRLDIACIQVSSAVSLEELVFEKLKQAGIIG